MRPLPRFRALLLTLLFAGVGSGAPVLDALLFHSGKNGGQERPHIETRDNPACHGEQCVLGVPLATTGSAPATTRVVAPLVQISVPAIVIPVVVLRSTRLSDSLRSRAPPSLLA
ncbi:MAG: hypothetical protein ACHQXA_06340 [Gemmatimonadales bacterium]